MASDRAALEAFFETNDIPTQGQYTEFITSVPNIVDDYKSVPLFTLQSDIIVPSADVLTSFTTPVDIVPDPGASLTIIPFDIAVLIAFNTTAYATNTNIRIRSKTKTINIFDSNLILGSTVTTFRSLMKSFVAGANVDQFASNQPLQFQTITGNPTAGDSDLRFFVSYFLVPV